ncbi:FAD-binding oxidoreductase [Burkholderia sp. FERM BP-3421]|jgi:glycine/D-amino acid oxidase-like deaminating enzyme|uniref:NAD(P)/FAD-dependent oxidoreductase n=1 Tax=Burkholderia sp. FERM BP-3421 TaxID=1494466 RepID=UPI00235EF3FA|nr:FAD-binding oxidoreductase [Burkholderia sp. FERM BP-3421]WDD93230.1 FAD-binding oxidoreductase [Burkholderia sp. FERM BP-3421]
MTPNSFMPTSTLWAATTLPRQAAPPISAPLSIDVAVIGGGFTGLSAALHLAQSGIKVALFEAHEIAHRASGRNGGQVVPGFKPTPSALIARFGAERAARMMRFAYRNADELFELVERYRIDCDAARGGWIQGAYSDMSARYLRARAEEINMHGGDVEYLERDAMAAATGSTFWPAGLLERRAGAVHPLAYARGFANAAIACGAIIHEHSHVSAVIPTGSRIALTVNGYLVHARQVILATDAYTDRLWPAVAQSYVTVSSAQIATDPLPSALRDVVMPRRAGISETRKITYYCRIDPEGRFVIGGRGRSAETLDPATRAQLRNAAIKRYPELADATWPHGWVCRVGMTIDDLPRLHRLADGVWTAYGYCGRGVAMGTALGRVLAQAVRGHDVAQLDFPVTPISRLPLYPARQLGAALAINWHRLRDTLGYPA